MDSALVIKVTYGDTLRRFTTYIDENGPINLDMGELRLKILGLFKFSPDADLTLTYNDEDNDVVALVDDDDLRDAIRQCLNPLRINVRLNNGRAGRSDFRTSGSSTPMMSVQVQHPLSNTSSGISEALKSVPEPFRDSLSKFSHDLTSKAASSAPALTELVESLSKLGLFYLGPVSQSQQAGSTSSSHNGASESPIIVKVTEDKDASKDKLEVAKALSNDQFVTPANNQNELDSGNFSSGVGTLVVPTTASVDLNLDPPGGSVVSSYPAIGISAPPVFASNGSPYDNGKNAKKVNDVYFSGNSKAPGSLASPDPLTHLKLHSSRVPDTLVQHHMGLSGLGADNHKHLPSGSGHSSASQIGFIPQVISIDEQQTGVDGFNQDFPSGRVHPFRRGHNYFDRMGRIFHRGIRCDGCGVYPITGPRYKSKVKVNYDLCNICFLEMGNETEYIRIDRPLSHQTSLLLEGSHDPFQHRRFQTPSRQLGLLGYGVKACRSKLDSYFIQDVNVVDGTMMAPATPFTKIWRMRNSGTVSWPHGTQLVWIGGDHLTDRVSVEIEIPMDGYPVDKELDIAVGFTAPELPGQYISYWRVASPSGQKFGQRVWALIQVDGPLMDPLSDSFHGLNLNLPPQSIEAKGRETIDVNVEPVDGGGLPMSNESMAAELMKPIVNEKPNKGKEIDLPVDGGGFSMSGESMAAELVKPMVNEKPNKGKEIDFPVDGGGLSMSDESMAAELVKPMVNEKPNKGKEIDFPGNDGLHLGSGVLVQVPPEVPAPISYPIIDFSVPASEPSVVADLPASPEEVNVDNDLEQILLKELEEMGFKHIDLNKEILRMNEYNFEQSLDDLCGAIEWDPILEELQEMGFHDKETNKKLLIKNGGSIKRVVLDLIAEEKA